MMTGHPTGDSPAAASHSARATLAPWLRQIAGIAALACMLAGHGAALAQAPYATAEAAADALIEAVAANDRTALTKVLGKDAPTLVPLDRMDPADVRAFVDKARQTRSVRMLDGRKAELSVGADDWVLPIPLLQRTDGRWQFDVSGGLRAVLEQRIGNNERSAMRAMLAYLDAQREYATVDRIGSGALQYARRLVSNPGKRDGLIWSPDLGDESPLGQAFIPNRPGTGYHGYHFRILTGQGPQAPGGATSYLIGDRMVSGFALIAWPVSYGQSGVMSFIVNHDGVIYERNLGPNGAKIAASIQRFNPDSRWRQTQP